MRLAVPRLTDTPATGGGFAGIVAWVRSQARAFYLNTVEPTTTRFLGVTDYAVIADTTAAGFTVTLPGHQSAQGWGPYFISNQTGANNLTVSGDATINGGASMVLAAGKWAIFIPTPTEWVAFGN